MLIVLVTGSMGTGKSTVTTYLKAKSYPVFQADVQAKQFLNPASPCYSDLKKLFNAEILVCTGGEFDKKKLSQEIFRNPIKRKAMELIIHPLVQEAFKEFVKKQESKGQDQVFYEVPLLSKAIFDRFDKKILITCPKSLKIKRLTKAGWTRQEIEERWAAQISDSDVLDKVDFIIDNKQDLEHLYQQIDGILPLIHQKV